MLRRSSPLLVAGGWGSFRMPAVDGHGHGQRPGFRNEMSGYGWRGAGRRGEVIPLLGRAAGPGRWLFCRPIFPGGREVGFVSNFTRFGDVAEPSSQQRGGREDGSKTHSKHLYL
jgi:hypothetical protein